MSRAHDEKRKQMNTALRTRAQLTAALFLLVTFAAHPPALGQAMIGTQTGAKKTRSSKPLYTYTLAQDGNFTIFAPAPASVHRSLGLRAVLLPMTADVGVEPSLPRAAFRRRRHTSRPDPGLQHPC